MHNVVISDGRREITFLNSAIKIKNYSTMIGERHCNILQDIADAGLTDLYKENHIDGFLCRLSNGTITFIDRDNATRIAKRANYPMIGSVLTSEDLW